MDEVYQVSEKVDGVREIRSGEGETKMIFISLFVLIALNIGALFVVGGNIFVKTLIILVASTIIFYYILAWIKTFKSIKNRINESDFKDRFLKGCYNKIMLNRIRSKFGITDDDITGNMNVNSIRSDVKMGILDAYFTLGIIGCFVLLAILVIVAVANNQ